MDNMASLPLTNLDVGCAQIIEKTLVASHVGEWANVE